MALTPTLLLNEKQVALASSRATASISPSVNTLLVVLVTMKKLFGTAGGTVACSGLSLTWTNRIHKVQTDAWTDAFTAPAGASPGSGALTISVSGNASDQRWSDIIVHILEVPVGFDPTTPVAQVASNGASGNTTGATMTVTLGATPAADSVVIGFIGSMETNGAVTADGTFAELAQDSNGNNDFMTGQSQYDDASADTTVQWTAIDRLDGGKHTAAIALEIAAAAGTAPAAPSDLVAVLQ